MTDSTETEKPKQPARRRRRPVGGLLDPHGEIASRLRVLYAEVEREPIPTELIDLLERLDEAEAKSNAHD
jgi:hypothetical protein